MNVREYARAQQRPIGPLHKLIRAILHSLGVPVTDDHVFEVALRLYRPMQRARDYNYDVALAYLKDLDPNLVAPNPRDYPIEAIQNTVSRVVGKLRIEGEPIDEANRADIRVIEIARKAIDGPLTRQAVEPARETVAKIGENDERYGWARVLVGAYSCSFCAMLASRGAVYTSKAAAYGKGGSPLDLFHTPYVNDNGKTVGGFCDCQAIPVPKGKPWEGQAAAKALSKLWNDHEGDLNAKGERDPLNAFRRAWDAKARAGETSIYLPASLQNKPTAA